MTISRWGWPLFAFLSAAVALISLRSLLAPVAEVMPNMAHFVTDAPLALWGHILGGPLVLALAPVQASTWLRARWPRAHRVSGRVYAAGVLVAGLSSLALVPTAEASAFAKAGFAALGTFWIFFTFRGIWSAMSGDYTSHRRWMIRSLTLTFGAVTLRLIMLPLSVMGWTVAETYDVTAWGCWLPFLILVELWQQRRARPALA